jgi:hypothetical protein
MYVTNEHFTELKGIDLWWFRDFLATVSRGMRKNRGKGRREKKGAKVWNYREMVVAR